MIITIDGSAGCGKSTLAKNLSKKYNCQFVSTGNIYRAVALMAIENKIKYYDEPELKKLVEKLNIRIFDGKIFVNGKNLTHFLHTRKVDGLVALYAGSQTVRNYVNNIVADLCKNGETVVIEGRNTGVLIPNAVKIFLEASAEERARRSYVRNLNNEIRATLEQCLANINERDNICNSRKNPKDRIVCPRGAVRINTTKLSEEEVCTIAEKIIKRSTLVKKPVKKFKCKDVLE